MDWFSGVVAFILIWWLVLFMVLPWGNNPEEKTEKGNATSAPAKPRILLKFMVTTGISVVLWSILYILVSMDIVDFFDIAEKMMIEDKAE